MRLALKCFFDDELQDILNFHPTECGELLRRIHRLRVKVKRVQIASHRLPHGWTSSSDSSFCRGLKELFRVLLAILVPPIGFFFLRRKCGENSWFTHKFHHGS